MKMKSTLRSGLLAASATAAILTGGAAQAGGFINNEQSAVFNGLAYAGFAAPGSTSPSGMYINPALMTEFNKITYEGNFSVVQPETRIRGVSGVIPGAFGGTLPSGDIGQDVLVPASYLIVPLGYGFTAGVSFNVPYGSITKPATPWGGQLDSLTTKLKTYTFTPSLAYEINPQLSVGVGLQIQYMKVSLEAAGGAGPTPPVVGVKGDGWNVGVTAGLTWKPFMGTSIGVGYRSRIDQKLDGDFLGFPLPAGFTSASTTVRLPDRVNVSLRQTIVPQFDLLASAEWLNWSRIGTSAFTGPALANPLFPLRVLPLEYKDGWMFALGGEYRWDPNLTLRAGVAYEISPIDTAVRTTRLPDNDRIWLSTGLSYAVTDRITVNASYSRVIIRSADIREAAPFGAVYTGQAKSHADIFSLGFTTKWGSDPAPVLKNVVRKG
ncbi:OmpP1/FadL family transporter [Terrarubrum flagellatum]|uniref:OmpP1/FadL family transporter n=1 Tax=Terrirubrum flagellatum TaxID=2895980 RepID=UPI003144E2EB